MNKLDLDYQNLLKDILENGTKKETRNGSTISVFGYQIRHDMKSGFPLLTTKKMAWKQIVTELLWFLRGDTNIKYLVDNNCHIWDGDAYKEYRKQMTLSVNNGYNIDRASLKSNENGFTPYAQEEFINKIKTDDEFAKKWGELGPVYGRQWRSWEGLNSNTDQIANLINDLKTNPDSRRLMVNAWNVGEIDQMVLPPCHYGFQVYTRELTYKERYKIWFRNNFETGFEYNDNIVVDFDNSYFEPTPTRAISLIWNQRSVDTFLGLPFNIASYGLLLEIIAKEVNMVPDELIGNLGDVHLYNNHIEQAKEQIGRELTLEERRAMVTQEQFDKIYTAGSPDSLSHSEIDQFGTPRSTREPFELPIVKLSSGHNLRAALKGNLNEIDPNDIMLINYQSHPAIKAPLSN